MSGRRGRPPGVRLPSEKDLKTPTIKITFPAMSVGVYSESCRPTRPAPRPPNACLPCPCRGHAQPWRRSLFGREEEEFFQNRIGAGRQAAGGAENDVAVFLQGRGLGVCVCVCVVVFVFVVAVSLMGQLL